MCFLFLRGVDLLKGVDFEWLPLLIKSVIESEKILKSCLILCLDL